MGTEMCTLSPGLHIFVSHLPLRSIPQCNIIMTELFYLGGYQLCPWRGGGIPGFGAHFYDPR
ncbi:hypothetical protein BGZ63DRAFT_390087 [Mariannaea sp. PMI_226]|nr:hypothetical protein BGZ63DRAFT_390087 [Mariannaea sp. PMI_226]